MHNQIQNLRLGLSFSCMRFRRVPTALATILQSCNNQSAILWVWTWFSAFEVKIHRNGNTPCKFILRLFKPIREVSPVWISPKRDHKWLIYRKKLTSGSLAGFVHAGRTNVIIINPMTYSRNTFRRFMIFSDFEILFIFFALRGILCYYYFCDPITRCCSFLGKIRD